MLLLLASFVSFTFCNFVVVCVRIWFSIFPEYSKNTQVNGGHKKDSWKNKKKKMLLRIHTQRQWIKIPCKRTPYAWETWQILLLLIYLIVFLVFYLTLLSCRKTRTLNSSLHHNCNEPTIERASIVQHWA